VRDSALGRAFIKALRPVSYKWIDGGGRIAGYRKTGKQNVVGRKVVGTRQVEQPVRRIIVDEEGAPSVIDAVELVDEPIMEDVVEDVMEAVIERHAGKRMHWGLIAQEVKAAVDAAGVEDFAGWILSDAEDPASEQAMCYTQFIAPLIKAIQELSTEVEELKAKLASKPA
jgi:hypothetical protein